MDNHWRLTMPLPLGPLGSDPWDPREWQNWDSSSPENLAEVRVLKCIRTFHVIRCSLMFQKHIGIRIVFHQPWPGFTTPLINSRKMTSLTHPIISGWLGSQHLQLSSAGRYQKTTMVSGKVGHHRTTGPVWKLRGSSWKMLWRIWGLKRRLGTAVYVFLLCF